MLPIAVLWGCVMCSVSILVEVVLFSKNVLDNTCIEGGHRWPHRVVGGHINFAGGHINWLVDTFVQVVAIFVQGWP